MSYWGYRVEENDFAFGSVGANIYLIKDRLFKDIDSDKDFDHPEQSILAMLVCLRLLGERFPESLSVHFRKKDFAQAKAAFYAWYEKNKKKIPKELKEKVFLDAENEFKLFEEKIFSAHK